MKIKNVFLLLLLGTISVHSQSSESISEGGNHQYEWIYLCFDKWLVRNDTIYGDGCSFWVYKIDESDSTVIQGKNYMKMYCMPMYFPLGRMSSVKTSEARDYTIGLRREDGRVYVNSDDYLAYLSWRDSFTGLPSSFGTSDYVPYRPTGDGELVLYDYNMEIGDTYIHVEGYDDVSVVKKETVTLEDMQPRRKLELSNGLVLIEGVGCINSNGLLVDYLNPQKCFLSKYSYLDRLCRCDDNFVIYENTDSRIIDTSTLGLHATAKNAANNNPTYDLKGRPLTTMPRKGVLVEKGRKQVVK